MWHFTNGPESCWSPWCQSTSEEDEFEDNRQMDKSHNMLPLTHPPTPPASTSCPHPQSFQTLPRANHKPVSIAMSQLSSVINFLAACRMKEDQKGVKSCAGELGGGNIRKKSECAFGITCAVHFGGWGGGGGPAGSGMESCGQARLSLSWMQI